MTIIFNSITNSMCFIFFYLLQSKQSIPHSGVRSRVTSPQRGVLGPFLLVIFKQIKNYIQRKMRKKNIVKEPLNNT